MTKKNIILLGLVLWILLGILCLLTHAKKIENKLTDLARVQLQAANLADVQVSFSGRDALLSGTVPSEDWLGKAADLIREIRGVRTVDNRLALAEAKPTTPETLAVATPVQPTEPPKPETPEIDLSTFKINFASDSYRLEGNSGLVLNQIQQKLTANSRLRIKIVGHADSRGTTTYNLSLSKKRAETVKASLVKKGTSQERLLVEGRGESQPIADNSTPSGREKNRRVEFFNAED